MTEPRLLPIKNCDECKHRAVTIKRTSYCLHPDITKDGESTAVKGKELSWGGDIPDWCPLERTTKKGGDK